VILAVRQAVSFIRPGCPWTLWGTPCRQNARPGRCPGPGIIALQVLMINQVKGGLLLGETPGILKWEIKRAMDSFHLICGALLRDMRHSHKSRTNTSGWSLRTKRPCSLIVLQRVDGCIAARKCRRDLANQPFHHDGNRSGTRCGVRP
jgi:hypothetical protein